MKPRNRSLGDRGLLAEILISVILLAACSTTVDQPSRVDVPPNIQFPATPSAAAQASATQAPSSSPSSTPGPIAATAPTPGASASASTAVAPPSGAPAVSGYRIAIPRLGINLPIAEGDVPRDVDAERTPEHYAFHLPGTSMFGAGNTYLYAHARIGMFLNLWNARIGDVVIVRTPVGTTEYLVAEIHPRVSPTEISWAGPTPDTRLTLQTSTGPNSDDPRFVVIARPR